MAGKRGQPPKYREEYAEQAYELCLLGATDKKLAKFFKVAESTINNWKKEHEDFYAALQDGKDEHDSLEVEKSFLKRAKGFRFTEVTREVVLVEKEVEGFKRKVVVSPELVVTKKVSKFIPPDTAAGFIWLKNRRPHRWRDKINVDLEGNLKVEVIDSYETPQNGR